MASVWLIAGPTASGKSGLAEAVALATGGEIVNADSMQLYRELPVLTACPSAAEQAKVPHHLYQVADAADGWSVGRWLRAATEVLGEIAARGRDAVLVGGTGLYFAALTRGLAEIPAVPPAVRRAVQARYEEQGEAAFRATLRAVDPLAEGRIALGDRQRLTRAFEVVEATGRALTAWQAETRPPLADYRALVLSPLREALYARCDARLGAMVERGALDEARALISRDLDPRLPLMKAVGLRELGRHLAGEITLAEALDAAAQETRRYAKRQSTWFRNQTPDWPRIEAFGEDVEARLLERR